MTNAGFINVITSTLTVSGALNNSGQTQVSQGGTVTVQGNVTNSGVIDSKATFAVQGTLNNSGQLYTGNSDSPGAINATGTLTQEACAPATLAGCRWSLVSGPLPSTGRSG